ncbi:hypothetical protein [Streptomyces sp. NPDC059176]|uniref:hypothetical protein n=1 Tax=unclassified Streptomyces TaxID=2593676 RepID=UPI003675B951
MGGAGGGGGSGGGGDLERGLGALKNFQKKVNKLLGDLEEGAGSATKFEEQRVSRASFSGSSMPFAEADGFYSQYNRVHTSLVSLSKSLSDQIELLSIGVHGADVGFNNVEDEMRRRFHQIQTRLDARRETEDHGGKGAGSGQHRNKDNTLPTDIG